MKRREAAAVAVVLAAGALAAPGAQAAKTSHYEGANQVFGGGPDYVVSFDAVKRRDGSRKVKYFSTSQLPWSCDNDTSGYYPTGIPYPETMKVNRQGRFHGSADPYEYNGLAIDQYDVAGQLAGGGTANGTVQIAMHYDAMTTVHCSSTVRSWSAQKVAAP
jgi:hypothetical protein